MTALLKPVPKSSRIERMQALPAWWRGAAIARKELIGQSTSDRERDAHLTAISSYGKRAQEAGGQ